MPGTASQTEREDFKLGDLCVSPSLRQVTGPSGVVSLEPLVLQLLLLLADTDGRLLSRTKLFERLWSSPLIGDNSLNRLAAALRRALAQVGSRMQLETVPRAGYRLIGVGTVSLAASTEDPSISRRRLLVGVGVGLPVAATAGWWLLRPNPREMEGERLGALGERMLRFDVPGERQRTVEILSRATELRPDDARMWGLLAYAKARTVSAGEGGSSTSKMMSAEEAIARARGLRSDEPNAELALLVLSKSVRDWNDADRVLRAVLSRDPGNVFALSWLVALTQSSGHAEESWKLNERQIALSPLSPEPRYRRTLKLWIFNRVDEADRNIDPLLRLWPKHPWVWNARFVTYAFTGRLRAALSMLDHPDFPSPGLKPAFIAQWRPTLAALDRPAADTLAAARQANIAAAAASPGQAAYAVMALSAIGEVDAAFEVATGFLLAKGSVVTGDASSKPLLLSSPTWKQTQWLFTPPTMQMRRDPRFPGFVEQIGLAKYWRERGPADRFLMS